MPKESIGATKWCHLRYSNSLRTAVRLRMKNYNVAEACREVGLHQVNLYSWLSGERPKAISQWKLIRFLKKIGIKVDLKIEYEL